MQVEQAQKILELGPDADLQQVKKAYRRLAFKFHPDLNPQKPDAVAQFQRVNKAYILLKRVVPETVHKGPTGEQEQDKGPAPPPGGSGSAAESPGFERGGHRKRFHFRQEEVLRDILSDPFAKKVFEDIFERVKKNKGPGSGEARPWKSPGLEPGSDRGFLQGIKKWFAAQLDDEQTVYLRPQRMLPGSRIRIQIGRKLGGETKSIDVTIPSDYMAGRPIRLKGLGRCLGRWKGDLYLKLMVR
ncbi:MAG: DnaJ domain-containing protein [Desulfonatronovibrionaceae bacterium]